MLTKLGVAPRFAELTPRALSYLVLTHDGLYDDAHDVYKVAFTSRLNAAKGLLPLPDGQDLSHATVLGLVSRAADFAQSFAAVMVDQKLFPAYTAMDSQAARRELQQHLGTADAYLPCLEHAFLVEPAPSLTCPNPPWTTCSRKSLPSATCAMTISAR